MALDHSGPTLLWPTSYAAHDHDDVDDDDGVVPMGCSNGMFLSRGSTKPASAAALKAPAGAPAVEAGAEDGRTHSRRDLVLKTEQDRTKARYPDAREYVNSPSLQSSA